jgi:phosphatidylglycerol:prolipoprotein diacylglycerol transferase
MLTILTGMIPTRLGCLLNGCCGGRPTTHTLAVSLPDVRGDWQPRLPLQLYEVAWAVVLLIAALAMFPVRPFDGAVFLTAAAGYGAARIVIEPLREESDWLGPVRVSSVISIGLVAGGLSALVLLWPAIP